MEKKDIQSALKKIREGKKRKFPQSIDLIINLRNLNMKKTEDQVDFFLTLPTGLGKKRKVCAIVGPELYDDAKKVCDLTIHIDNLNDYKKKVREAKKIARENDFFVAQANIMPQVAGAFGRILGPKGKMPNPKAGAVVPPKTNMKALYEKFQRTLRVMAKTAPMIQILIGTEEQDDQTIMDNLTFAYNNVIHHLPKEKHNVREVLIKTTMGKPHVIAH